MVLYPAEDDGALGWPSPGETLTSLEGANSLSMAAQQDGEGVVVFLHDFSGNRPRDVWIWTWPTPGWSRCTTTSRRSTVGRSTWAGFRVPCT